jgi:hypothetical protein
LKKLKEYLKVYKIKEADLGKFLWAHTLEDKNDAVIYLAQKRGIWPRLDMIKNYESKS